MSVRMPPSHVPSCIICSAPLASPREGPPHCANALCAWKYRTIPAHRRCAVCGVALSDDQLARRTCARDDCQRIWLVDRPLAHKRKVREETRQAAAMMRDAAVRSGQAGAGEWPVTLTPHNYASSYRLPRRRVKAIREHIAKAVAEAFAHRQAVANGSESPREPLPPLDPPTADVAAVLLHACIGCRGFCCRTAGDHAYITPHTILHYLAQHPDQGPEEVVAAYLAHLPTRVLRDGCTFQHARGCVLPREMRSDTCNRFYCDTLKEHRQKVERGEPPGVFWVPSHDGEFSQGTFAAPGFVQLVRRQRVMRSSLESESSA